MKEADSLSYLFPITEIEIEYANRERKEVEDIRVFAKPHLNKKNKPKLCKDKLRKG